MEIIALKIGDVTIKDWVIVVVLGLIVLWPLVGRFVRFLWDEFF